MAAEALGMDLVAFRDVLIPIFVRLHSRVFSNSVWCRGFCRLKVGRAGPHLSFLQLLMDWAFTEWQQD